MAEPIEDYLAHHASKYYDPVKAHEYYLKTRELKGRRSSSNLNAEGKKVWSYTKNEISTAKKNDVQEEKNNHDNQIKELRAKADKTRESISSKLEELRKSLSDITKWNKDLAEDKRDAAIERLQNQKIPEGLSEEERARRISERNEKIAKLRDDAKEEKATISESSSKTRAQYSSDAKAQRAKVASDLKAAISATREAYKTAKTSLDESYETIYQKEYDKIRAEYGK